MYKYKLFGQNILSCYKIYGIETELEDDFHEPDITIESELIDLKIIREVDETGNVYNNYIVKDTGSFTYIKKTNSWLVRISKQGNKVVVHSLSTEIDDAVSCIQHLGINACLYFKGFIPFHASGISYKDETIGFLASSGDGKTTIALIGLIYGAKFVTDDTLAVKIDHGNWFVYPSQYLMPKLDITSSNYLKDVVNVSYDGLVSESLKNWIHVDKENRETDVRGIKIFYYLDPQNNDEYEHNTCIELLDGKEKSKILFEHVNNKELLSILDQMKLYKKICISSNNIKLFKVKYFKNFCNASLFIKEIVENDNKEKLETPF